MNIDDDSTESEGTKQVGKEAPRHRQIANWYVRPNRIRFSAIEPDSYRFHYITDYYIHTL